MKSSNQNESHGNNKASKFWSHFQRVLENVKMSNTIACIFPMIDLHESQRLPWFSASCCSMACREIKPKNANKIKTVRRHYQDCLQPLCKSKLVWLYRYYTPCVSTTLRRLLTNWMVGLPNIFRSPERRLFQVFSNNYSKSEITNFVISGKY